MFLLLHSCNLLQPRKIDEVCHGGLAPLLHIEEQNANVCSTKCNALRVAFGMCDVICTSNIAIDQWILYLELLKFEDNDLKLVLITKLDNIAKMSSFKKCFRRQLPYSLLIYPCVPCMGDGYASYLLIGSILCLAVYFVSKFYFREDVAMSGYLTNDAWMPYYFSLWYALAITFFIFILTLKRQSDKGKFRLNKVPRVFLNSLGVGLVIMLSSIASLKVYDVIHHLPIGGQIASTILAKIENYFGANAPRVVASWWGIAMGWLLVFVPMAVPYLGSILTLVPQNQVLVYIGYLIVCMSSQ